MCACLSLYGYVCVCVCRFFLGWGQCLPLHVSVFINLSLSLINSLLTTSIIKCQSKDDTLCPSPVSLTLPLIPAAFSFFLSFF